MPVYSCRLCTTKAPVVPNSYVLFQPELRVIVAVKRQGIKWEARLSSIRPATPAPVAVVLLEVRAAVPVAIFRFLFRFESAGIRGHRL